MERIKIVTDSTAGLSPEVLHSHDIAVIPMVVTLGNESFEETALSRDEFWHRAAHAHSLRTSQPAIGAFERLFKQWVEAGYRVLCVMVSSRYSGAFHTAASVARGFGDRVVVEDSQSLSQAQGIQVITAARLAAQGAPLELILAAMRSIRQRSRIVIQLDVLEALRRGGRAVRLMPILDRFSRVLSLKPLLTLVEGELRLLGVARSYRKGVARIKEEILGAGSLQYVAVVHTRRPEIAQELADELAGLARLTHEQVFVDEVGGAIACHAGEGLIAAMGVSAD